MTTPTDHDPFAGPAAEEFAVPLRRTVPLGGVESALSGLIRDAHGRGEAPVVQARMSNLIIFCNSSQRADLMTSIVPEIVAIHPARVLMLLCDPTGAEIPETITASVSVRSRSLGKSARVVSDQITLSAGGRAVHDLPFAVRGLLIGDLPTNLLWATPQPPPLAGPLLDVLSESAQQLIYDSLGWSEPARGMATLASWLDGYEDRATAGRWRVASDLNWRRLKTWRRLLNQAIDPSTPGHPESVTEIAIEHGPHSVMVAFTLASWLALRLGWTVQDVRVKPGAQVDWRFTARDKPRLMTIRRVGGGPVGIHSLRMACLFGEVAGTLVARPDGENRLAVVPEGIDAAPRTITLQEKSLAELIGRQLSDREHDPVFHETMEVAQTLARRVIGP